MMRFAFAALLVATFGNFAVAQQPIPAQPTPPVPFIQPPTNVPPGPAITYEKSGGVVFGANGFLPYDTGDWLLAGTQGVSRQSGYFSMVIPAGPVAPAPGGMFGGKHRFHKR